jgi:hypothetical protein
MKLKLPSPSVKNAGKTGEIGSEESCILGQNLQGFGGGMKKGFITYLLMGTDDKPQDLRERERDQEVGTRELTGHLLFEPHPGFVMLALRTVPVSAGTKDVVNLPAIGAFIDGYSVNRRAALDHGLDGFIMDGGHINAEALDIFEAVSAEDVGNRLHVTTPS